MKPAGMRPLDIVAAPREAVRNFFEDHAALSFGGFVLAYGAALTLAAFFAALAYLELVATFGDPA